MRTTLVALFAAVACAVSVRAAAPPDRSARKAVEKSLKRIEQGLANYPKHRQCFSCHHHAVGVFSLTAARERGFPVESKFVQAQIDFSVKTFRNNRSQIAQGRGVGGDSTSVAYALNTFAAVQRPYDETTAALVEYLVVKQRKDGSWPIPAFGDRPPTMGSLFTNTGLAVVALKRTAVPKDVKGAAEKQKRMDAAFASGRDWLLANKPVSTEDRVFHLHGLVAAECNKEVESAREALLQEQRKDGSWAQLSKMDGDAYATSTALVALGKAGLDANKSEAYHKGVRYLIRTQRADGAWVVQTRSKPLQRFFDNGDPGGKDQFISFAATNWAVLALLETMPPADRTRRR